MAVVLLYYVPWINKIFGTLELEIVNILRYDVCMCVVWSVYDACMPAFIYILDANGFDL